MKGNDKAMFRKQKSEVNKLELKLEKSNSRLKTAIKALAPKHVGGEMEEYYAAREENLMLQRNLALAKGEETAMPLVWNIEWDTGAPCPHVVSSGEKTFLIYHICEKDPNWDGSYVKVIDSTSEEVLGLALVEFISCYSIKFGGANDEVLNGHPLWGKGLEPYNAHVIENSKWIKEEKKINSVHPYYNEARWNNKKHYLLLFHDELVECIAEGYSIEVFRDTFSNVLMEALKSLKV